MCIILYMQHIKIAMFNISILIYTHGEYIHMVNIYTFVDI